jgi:ubiquinone/menaquinone biosynthesis C-methylase UbiE
MSFYDHYILPVLLDFAMRQKTIRRQRAKIVPQASGRVLEVGIGSGLNLEFYDPDKVTEVLGLDPSAEMKSRARKRVAAARVPVSFVGLSGEEIPLESASVDTVLFTYTLCTIPKPLAALDEMRRVLKPGGQLLFCEHGRAPDQDVFETQMRIEPTWSKWTGGCHLTRDVPDLLTQGGFAIDRLDTMYLPGPRFGTFNYWGSAQIR